MLLNRLTDEHEVDYHQHLNQKRKKKKERKLKTS